jgi:hypothetical protein
MTWRVGYSPTGHTWRGFSKEDAYGAALAYIDTVWCCLHGAACCMAANLQIGYTPTGRGTLGSVCHDCNQTSHKCPGHALLCSITRMPHWACHPPVLLLFPACSMSVPSRPRQSRRWCARDTPAGSPGAPSTTSTPSSRTHPGGASRHQTGSCRC